MATSGKPHDSTIDRDRAVVDRLVSALRRRGPRPEPTPVAAPIFRGLDRPANHSKPFEHARPARPRSAAIWVRVALGVVVSGAVVEWPYARACGAGLLLYLAAAVVVIVTGVWGAMFSWDARLGAAHIVSLCTIVWGLALAAHEVLSRVGYAKDSAVWWCGS